MAQFWNLLSLSLPRSTFPAPNPYNLRLRSVCALVATQPPHFSCLSLSLPLRHSFSLSSSTFVSKSFSLSSTPYHSHSRSPFSGKPTATRSCHWTQTVLATLDKAWRPSTRHHDGVCRTCGRVATPYELCLSPAIFHSDSDCQQVPLNLLVIMVPSVIDKSTRIISTFFPCKNDKLSQLIQAKQSLILR